MLKTLKIAVAIVALGLLSGYIGARLAAPGTVATPEQPRANSVYDRIMADHTIRCAYQVWPPYMAKDPNTGALSGVYYDLTEAVGAKLGLKIVWAEEVGSGNLFDGFKTRRYDVACTPITPSPERSLVADFTKAFTYIPFYLYVRDGDTRFDGHYAAANDPSVTFAAIEGDYTKIIADEDFPKASQFPLMNLTSGVDMLMAVRSGKASAAVVDPSTAGDFMAQNPDTIRKVEGGPVRFLGIGLTIPRNEPGLLRVLDITLDTFVDTGVIDRILTKYKLDPSMALRRAVPYAMPQP